MREREGAGDGVLDLPLSELALRLTLAAVFGGILGFEREWANKPAGLRTHMMVALGAACFTLVAHELTSQVQESETSLVDAMVLDPSRIVQGIVGGIGFLGAGVILRDKGTVEGLTTAGSIWLAGAVGIAAGAGSYALAGISVGLAVAILYALGKAEAAFPDADRDE